MRDEFRAITSGWMLIDGTDDIDDRIAQIADWMKANGPLEKDEESTVQLMIQCQVARGKFHDDTMR